MRQPCSFLLFGLIINPSADNFCNPDDAAANSSFLRFFFGLEQPWLITGRNLNEILHEHGKINIILQWPGKCTVTQGLYDSAALPTPSAYKAKLCKGQASGAGASLERGT